MWYKEAPKESFIGRQVVAWTSVMHQKGDTLTIVGWKEHKPSVVLVEDKYGAKSSLHASRVRLMDSNEDAVSLLREGN